MVWSYISIRDEIDTLRMAFKWKLQGKRLRGPPRKRRIDRVTEDLKVIDVENWRKIV